MPKKAKKETPKKETPKKAEAKIEAVEKDKAPTSTQGFRALTPA
jgi:hypothetical protein